MSVEHYENFPVGSILLPRRLRKPIHAVYAFARTADDIADEGGTADAERLSGLDDLQKETAEDFTPVRGFLTGFHNRSINWCKKQRNSLATQSKL